MKFNKQQIDQLRKAYEKIDRVDPNNPSYRTLIKLLDSLDQQQLKQLVDAKIKFVSKLALNRIKKESVNKSTNKSFVNETTIYSHLDGAFADIMRIMKSKTKGKSVVWKNIKTITMSTWMAEYRGYSKSDVEITGYITFYDIPNKNSWQITVEVTHPMRGRHEKDFVFKTGEDYTKHVESAAGFITSYMNM